MSHVTETSANASTGEHVGNKESVITLDRITRVLPVVADSWQKLRKTDVYRLMDSLGIGATSDINEAARIIGHVRPDLADEAVDCAHDLINHIL